VVVITLHPEVPSTAGLSRSVFRIFCLNVDSERREQVVRVKERVVEVKRNITGA